MRTHSIPFSPYGTEEAPHGDIMFVRHIYRIIRFKKRIIRHKIISIITFLILKERINDNWLVPSFHNRRDKMLTGRRCRYHNYTFLHKILPPSLYFSETIFDFTAASSITVHFSPLPRNIPADTVHHKLLPPAYLLQEFDTDRNPPDLYE